MAEAWRTIFRSIDPFAWPFAEDIKSFRVFYPTDGYHLTKSQLEALLSVLGAEREANFFLSIVESEDLDFLNRSWGHWSCLAPSYQEYSSVSITLENALFSVTGDWGVLVSHEMHALVGGDEQFLQQLDKEYKVFESDARKLRKDWRDHPNGEWVNQLFDHGTSGDQ